MVEEVGVLGSEDYIGCRCHRVQRTPEMSPPELQMETEITTDTLHC